MKLLNAAHIEENSYVDGPGCRTTIFFQGCHFACKGCQNKHLWPTSIKYLVDTAAVAKELLSMSPHGNITISGGEPFLQPEALYALVGSLRASETPSNPVHIIIYTGYTWESLIDNNDPSADLFRSILHLIDIVVDGQFIAPMDDDLLTWRGSRNQRPIDVQESIQNDWEPVVLDWDMPEIVVGEDGTIYLPQGLAQDFAELGEINNTRRCGQTK